MSRKEDGLGFQIVGHTMGRDIAQAWDYFWILFDKNTQATLYCFVLFIKIVETSSYLMHTTRKI
jgi:hypothetical protein